MASVEADEWLQLLAHHPMFGSQSTDNEGSCGRSSRGCLAVRGTELFAAVGNEVRWINLKACKDAFVRHEGKRLGLRNTGAEGGARGRGSAESGLDAVKAVPWYRLGCEALSFDISRLSINASGKLLAVVGSHQVAVVVLPPPGAVAKGVRGAFTAALIGAADDDESDEGAWIDCRSMLLATAPGAGPATPTDVKSDRDTQRRSPRAAAGLLAAANWSARTRVVDVLWHPLSTTSSHLLTLQANGSVKIFDVSEDVDTPEQTLSLFSASSAAGVGFAMSQAVSFCMGSPTSVGWSRATVYVLTNTGELYSLCPVLPQLCTIEQGWAEGLLETAELDVREWQAEEYGASVSIYTPPELIDARAAAKWLSQLLDLDKSRANAAVGAHHLHLVLPAALMQPVAAQGPYLFQPEPVPANDAAYDSSSSSDSEPESGARSKGGRDADCDPDDACDVLYMESSSGTGVGLVAIAYCDAHVEVFADLEPAIGRWVDTSARRTQAHDLPVLATLASIDLSVTPLAGAEKAKDGRQIGAVSLIADVLSPAVFYGLHTHGVHRVDMRSWTGLLDKAIGLGSEAERSAALDWVLFALDGRVNASSSSTAEQGARGALARSCVQCIVHTHPSASRPTIPVVGAVTIDDIYLSYSLLALVAPCQLVGVTLPLIGGPTDGGDGEEVVPGVAGSGDERERDPSGNRRKLDISAGAKDVVYVPRLPSSGYEAPTGLAGGSGAAVAPLQQPRLVLRDDSRGESGVSEERLKLLGSVAGQMRGQLAATVSAHSAMQKRLELQVQEHQRQHDKLSAIASGFQQHLQQMRQSQQRLDTLRENGQRVGLRVDQLLRQLLSHYQPELTPAERGFAHEVRDIDVQVNGADGYHRLVDRLQERVYDMQALAKLAAARAGGATADGRAGSQRPQLSKPALSKIEQMLEDEQSRLKETCSRIIELQDVVDCIPEEQLQA
ncbi:hypothetical protein LPJ61_000003 [Coemansia biformis]|uniref:Uncharacterized protein n=1 Tax=Coemansia biformis TaxID=1286918 RepID=A0A9W8D1Y2_9FUNG|nr:hypothetical protein LPJ61_000003 [Coemansia biformis]